MFPSLGLVFCLSLPCLPTSQGTSPCSAFDKYVLRKKCPPKEVLIPQNTFESLGNNSCNYFQKYILRKNDCSPKLSGDNSKQYSKCNFFEKHWLRNEYCKYIPDEYLDVPQIIARHGYLSETHTVVTQDGYILKIHRIRRSQNGDKPNQTVFLQHGILGSSGDWIINGDNSLAFLLADQGYDVWLGNARGNTYSRGHITFPVDSSQYWNFSFHEMGTKDLPTVLYYISNMTNSFGEIIYIGHSMGTTMFFVFASENPQGAKVVKVMIGMGPVAYMTHIKSPVKYLAPVSSKIEWLAQHLGFHQFLPNSKILGAFSYQCELFKIDSKICKNIIFSICGFNKEEFNTDILPVVISKDPAGVSAKTMLHYAQEIENGGAFQKFNYGAKGNLIHYNATEPPQYDIGKIDRPVYLIYGMDDWLANSTDIFRLGRELKNLQGLYRVPMESFNHLDYLFGKDAENLVYQPLLKYLRRYRNN